MQAICPICIRQLSYVTPEHKTIFNKLDITLTQQKTALLGRNGIGKSTLLKLIVGELQPIAGAIEHHATIAYVPQHVAVKETRDTVANMLDVADTLAALQRIESGSYADTDFETLGDAWDIRATIVDSLQRFGLSHINLNTPINTLSGGEITRLLLCKAFMQQADYLILDEPTNNLDITAREKLYQAIKEWQGGVLIVSHDRTLLNRVDHTVELSSLGATHYGGNYDHYTQQKALNSQAAQDELQTRIQALQNAKQTIQTRRERHQQNVSKGLRDKKAEIRARGHYDKLTGFKRQSQSDKTQRRISIQAKRKLEDIDRQLAEAKAKVEIKHALDIELDKTYVPSSKMILEIENLSFRYPNSSRNIINNLSFCFHGPQRVAITGTNGSGKSTLIKLILGQLTPTSGTIKLGTERISYLDQWAANLDTQLNLLENIQRANPDMGITHCYRQLAHFLFRNTEAEKLVSQLSGGEKLRAALACALMSAQPPQLLILDEPTNHLDIESLETIEAVLRDYQGVLVVVSHDDYFLQRIDMQETIRL